MADVCYVFKGAGGYIAWYFGYARYLQEHIDLSNATFGGTSAGSIIATFLATGIPINEIWHKWFIPLIKDLPPNFRFPSRDFEPIAARHARSIITPDVFQRVKGRLRISLTNTQLERVNVADFDSADDLIRCALTSCHVPWVIDGTAVTEYGRNLYMDGSLYNTINRSAPPYAPYGDAANHIHIQTPYKAYEQLASLLRFDELEFHYRNYINGYKYAEKNVAPQFAAPDSPHLDQSTVSL